METKLLAGIILFASCSMALAGDDELCMECHEPAEDWEGMSVEKIAADARAPDNKRHRDNDALSDEALRAIIERLLAE